MTAPQSYSDTRTRIAGSGLQGLLSNLTIGRKLAIGMSLVLGLLVVVSGSGYLGLSDAGSNTKNLAAITQNFARVAAADIAFGQIRRNVQVYSNTGSKKAETSIRDFQKILTDHGTLALANFMSDERREMMSRLMSKFEGYMAKVGELVKAKEEEQNLVDNVLKPAAGQANAGIEKLIEFAVNEFDPAAAANAGMALSSFLQQRLNGALYRSGREEILAEAADEQHDKAMAALAKLHMPAVSAEMELRTKEVEKLFDHYFRVRRDSNVKLRRLDAAFSAADKMAVEIRTEFDALNKAQLEAEDKILEKAVASVGMSSMVMLVVSAMALAIGILLVWLITREVATPVREMTTVMTKLAAGDLEVRVPAADKTNEIGQMAKAVLVFRDAAIDKIRMERDSEIERQRSEDARRQAEEAVIARERSMVAESVGAGMAKLAAKDLTYRLTDDLPEAYRQLQLDFNAAMDALERALAGVNAGTHELKSGTGEIAQASVDLSRRTEGQAATLEQTSAAISEITSTVAKTAEGAGRARTVVATAKTDAEQGNEIMRQAVGSMSDIEKSSKEITQIIGVIDEIAFQTNLLALNAGVEAARAGDAGRGFAVVASEVRALAQRSAEAAKQIKELISKSSTQVENGVKLVYATGGALDRIVVSVSEINTVVTDIARDAEQQTIALREVSTAVGQMDQVTQQNAAMVEEATAATQTLAEQTDKLANLVGSFQTGRRSSDEDMRAELQKVAPHAFAAPSGHTNGAAAHEPRLAPARQPSRRAAAAQPRLASSAAPAKDLGWEEF